MSLALLHSTDQSSGLGDSGIDGIKAFCDQHQCNRICRRLGLQSGKTCLDHCIVLQKISDAAKLAGQRTVGRVDTANEKQACNVFNLYCFA